MFSLIIAIISIALLVALIAVGGYFGGDSVVDAQSRTNAARLVSEEQQILAAMDLFQADQKRWPANVEELVSTGYLRSIPQGALTSGAVASSFQFDIIATAHAADAPASVGWSMPVARTPVVTTAMTVPKLTCRAYNLVSRGDDGILRQPFDVLQAQCYGANGAYRIVVRKPVATLAGVLDSSVEAGDLPSKDMADWWDAVPSASVKVPVDPVKVPKPELVLAGAGALDFGQVQVRQDVKSTSVSVSNRGKVAADGVAIQAPDGFSVVDSTCGGQLSAGASCSFAVSFAPVQAQTFSGQLKVVPANGASVQLSVSGAGVPAGATLGDLDFGPGPAGTPIARDAVVRNTGVGPLLLGGATASGPGFSVASGGSCMSTLPAGNSCTVKVTLLPSGIDAHAGVLMVLTDAGDLRANLTGQSLQAQFSLSQSALPQLDAQMGQAVLSSTVTVQNIGNLTSGAVSAVPSAGFALANNTCSSSLAAGATCSFRVSFTPTQSTSVVTGSVDVTGGPVPATVTVSGLGSAPNLTASALDFGTRAAASTTDLASQIQNVGKGPVPIMTPVVTGSGFSFVTTDCPSNLAVGATCTITARYTASATAGPATGTLYVNFGTGLNRQASLTGSSQGQPLTFSIGAGGTRGISGFAGAAGGATTFTYGGVTVTANGGNPGANWGAVGGTGGTGSGGDGFVQGGSGANGGAQNGYGAGGGGALGGVASVAILANGGSAGAQAADVSGLQAAVAKAGYIWVGAGQASRPDAAWDAMPGGDASGFGCGGGGGGVYGGDGGSGLLGGGGGGASAYFANYASNLPHSGGTGGRGAIVIQFSDTSVVVLTTGTTYDPGSKVIKKIWAVGGGGGGGGGGVAQASASGGGAGAVAYKSF